MVFFSYLLQNIITMNQANRSPSLSWKQLQKKSLFHGYKLMLNSLKSNREASSEKAAKAEIRHNFQNIKITKCEQIVAARKGSKDRMQLSIQTTQRMQRSTVNTYKHTSPVSGMRSDLKIDLKTFKQKQVDCVKTEEALIENKAMFHSERKALQSTPQTKRLTSRTMEIQDIIMTAPYFQEKGLSTSKASKIIKLKRPDK